jgi:hypothetical protein
MDGSLSFFELFMCFLSTFSGSVYTQQLYWRASNNRNSSGGMNYRNNLHDVSGSCWLYGGQLSMVIKFIANRLSAKNMPAQKNFSVDCFAISFGTLSRLMHTAKSNTRN